jgi:hypothetical protein
MLCFYVLFFLFKIIFSNMYVHIRGGGLLALLGLILNIQRQIPQVPADVYYRPDKYLTPEV